MASKLLSVHWSEIQIIIYALAPVASKAWANDYTSVLYMYVITLRRPNTYADLFHGSIKTSSTVFDAPKYVKCFTRQKMYQSRATIYLHHIVLPHMEL